MTTEEIIGNTVAAVFDKPFKFEGLHFKRWQAKIKKFLTLKKIANVLTEDIPVASSGLIEQTNGKNYVDSDGNVKTDEFAASDLWLTKEIVLWHENDYLKNHILNSLADDLYDQYNNCETAKHEWEALQKKYDIEDVETKKYVVSRSLKYQMT